MGEARAIRRLSDAAGRRADRGLSARFSLRAFLADERGATAIEYGLIVSLVFLVLLAAMTLLGKATTDMFLFISQRISAATGG